ncbi:MAG: hypothetical protein U0R44_02625 [Candidatus Micrarchaeia archaeon]
MRDRSFAPEKTISRLTLAFHVGEQEVLIDRIEPFRLPHSLVAKIQIERSVGTLSEGLVRKGEDRNEVTRVLSDLVGDRKADLAFICDFLDTACHYIDRLERPAFWIGLIGGYSCRMSGGESKRSLAVMRLFEEARASQGTEREGILVRSLE